MKEAEAQDYETLLIDLFKQADESGDGTLQSEEFMGVMERSGIGLTSEQVLLLMREADTDGDGNVSYSEVRGVAWRGVASRGVRRLSVRSQLVPLTTHLASRPLYYVAALLTLLAFPPPPFLLSSQPPLLPSVLPSSPPPRPSSCPWRWS